MAKSTQSDFNSIDAARDLAGRLDQAMHQGDTIPAAATPRAKNAVDQDDFDALDVPKLRALVVATDERLRMLNTEMRKTEIEAREAFQRQDMQAVEGAWAVRRELQQGLDELMMQRDRVDAALAGRLQPFADEWHERAHATAQAWRDRQASAVASIGDSIKTIWQEATQLETLPADMREQRRALQTELDQFGIAGSPVDWRLPEATDALWSLTEKLRDVLLRVGRLARDGR